MARLCDELGLNHFEILMGMQGLIRNCFSAGKLSRIMGEEIDPEMSPELAVKWIRAIAYREGEGDIWAEGTPRAAAVLGIADEVYKTHKFGYPPHWDGRYQGEHYPVWVVAALTWATQGRDPFDQEHGYVERYAYWVKEWQGDAPSMWGTETIPYEEICRIGAKIYGAEHANSGWPAGDLGYVDKEYVTVWHNHRAMMKGSLPVCDRQFPLLYDPDKPDKIGDIDAEVRLFNAVVGTDWTLDDMHKAAERAFNVQRAIHVRQGRTREHDESIIPYFEQPTTIEDEQQTLEADKFRDLLERLYVLRGWDKASGWPTRARLEELGLKDVADELAGLGKLP